MAMNGMHPQQGWGAALQGANVNVNGMGMGMAEPVSPDMMSPGGGWEDVQQIENKDEAKNDILTLEQIVIWSTHESMQDNDTMETLIMTHKMFTDSLTLLKQLRKRFFVPIPPDILNMNGGADQMEKEEQIKSFQSGVQKRIQLKVIKALRDWMKRHWAEDFHGNERVLAELDEWLKELSVYHELDIHNKGCVWIAQWSSVVNKESSRLRAVDWDKETERKADILRKYEHVDILDANKINSLLAKMTPEELADQITLIIYRLFGSFEARECLHQRWKDDKNKHLAPNIIGMIDQFNRFTIWIQIQILREKTLRKRATALKRFIKMGEHFRITRNYNSLLAVFSALKTAAIYRLKLAWNRVPERIMQHFQGWNWIFQRDHNHRNLRQLMNKAGGNPCVPHIGVFLQDLVFIDEGNKKKNEEANFGKIEMLNFNKCVRIADRIKNLQLFQHHKYKQPQNEKAQKVLLTEFEKIKDVTEDQIWDMSTNVVKQDKREDKKGLFGNVGGNALKHHHQIPPAVPV